MFNSKKIKSPGEEISKQEEIDKLVEYHINEAKNYSKFGIDVSNNLILESIGDLSKIDINKFKKRIYETCGRLRYTAQDLNTKVNSIKYKDFTSDDYNELADNIEKKAEEIISQED